MDSNTELAAELNAAMNDADRGIASGVSPSFTDGHRRFIGLAWSNREAILTALTQQPAEQIADGALGVTQRDIHLAEAILSGARGFAVRIGPEHSAAKWVARHAQQARAQALEEAAKVAEDRQKDWQAAIANGLQRIQVSKAYAEGAATQAELIAFKIRALQPHGQGGGE